MSTRELLLGYLKIIDETVRHMQSVILESRPICGLTYQQEPIIVSKAGQLEGLRILAVSTWACKDILEYEGEEQSRMERYIIGTGLDLHYTSDKDAYPLYNVYDRLKRDRIGEMVCMLARVPQNVAQKEADRLNKAYQEEMNAGVAHMLANFLIWLRAYHPEIVTVQLMNQQNMELAQEWLAFREEQSEMQYLIIVGILFISIGYPLCCLGWTIYRRRAAGKMARNYRGRSTRRWKSDLQEVCTRNGQSDVGYATLSLQALYTTKGHSWMVDHLYVHHIRGDFKDWHHIYHHPSRTQAGHEGKSEKKERDRMTTERQRPATCVQAEGERKAKQLRKLFQLLDEYNSPQPRRAVVIALSPFSITRATKYAPASLHH